MAFVSSSQSRSTGFAWQGVLMMLCLIVLAVLQFNIFGWSITLLFLPAAGISLWPRGASPLSSVIALFLLGLLLDFLSGGPFALWSIIFLTIYAVFRPFDRSQALIFSAAFLRWAGILLLSGLLSFVLAWFSTRHRPDMIILLVQLVCVLTIFPFIYGARAFFRGFAIDPDDRRF